MAEVANKSKHFSKLHYGQALIVSVSATVFFTILVPVQTMLANATMFSFGVGDVISEVLPWAMCVFLPLFAVLFASEIVVGRLLHVLLAVFLVCEYLEIGLFSIGLPPLDGDLRAMSNPFRVIINTGLWIVVGGGLIGCYHWIKRWSHFIALGVVVMAFASLIDVCQNDEPSSKWKNLADGFCPHYDVVKSVRFSSTRNVIVLILDTFRASMAAEALRREPSLASHFTGFVAYENNLAMHENTYRALPGLMTGKFLTPSDSASDYATSIHGPDSFIVPYVERNFPVYFSDQLLSHGYTNRRRGDFTKMTSAFVSDGSVFFRNSSGIPYVTLFDIVRFRLVPYRFKCRVISDAYEHAVRGGDSHRRDVYEEKRLYPMLLSEPLDAEAETALVVLHTSGPHGPICADRNGVPLEEPSQKIEDYNEYSVFVLRQVAAFMDGLKAKGLYDKSHIVIAADHGLIDTEGLLHMAETGELVPHGADSSILWVKPRVATAPFSSSTIPTSNCKVSSMMRTLAERDLSQDEVAAILKADGRRFYAKYGSAWYSFGRYLYFYEWQYDSSGRVTSCTNQGIFNAN